MQAWRRRLLHEMVPGLIRKWELRFGVKVDRYYLQRMKTKWGSANPSARSIRINTELSKKPQDLLEYVVVHEIAHLVERGHGERFTRLMDLHWPRWRESRRELNELPVPHF
jgi:predicted metal-dependent hydrolase